MMLREWSRLGALLAVTAVAAGCAEPTVPRRERPVGVPGASDPGARVARLALVPPADERPGDRLAATGESAPEKVDPAAQAPSPAEPSPVVAAEPPAGAQGVQKALEEERTGGENEAGLVDLPTKGGDRRLPRDLPAQPAGPSSGMGVPPGRGDSASTTETTTASTRRTATTGSDGERESLPSAPAPLPPPPPPPAMSPGTIGAPTLPAPAALRSDESASADSDRMDAVRGSGTGLPAYTVRSLLRRRESALQRCYDSLLLRAPSTGSGNLTVRLRIGPSGSLEQLDRVGGTLDDAEFERCVLEQLRRVGFPAADTPTVFTHSFSFAPSGAAAALTE